MADTKNIVLTPEGRQKLVDELEYREGAKHDEIVERIKEARGFGDLSENSEYDAAKEEQSHNESRINEIRQILATATIAAAGSALGKTVKNVREGMEGDGEPKAEAKAEPAASDDGAVEVVADDDDADAPADDAKFCGNCGAKNPAGNAFCSKCGEKLN